MLRAFLKPISSYFERPVPKPNPRLQLLVTPAYSLLASVVLLIVAVYPLLTLKFGRPTSWFGNFLFLLCATLSVFAPATLCGATFIDMIRRKGDGRVIFAFVLSLAGVAAIGAYIYLYLHQYAPAA